MNAMTPIRGTNATFPADFDHYRQSMQSQATRVLSMLEALSACLDDPERLDICIALVEDARNVAKVLNHELDSVKFAAMPGIDLFIAQPGGKGNQAVHQDRSPSIPKPQQIRNEPPSALQALYHEWQRTKDEYEALPSDDDGRAEHLFKHLLTIEQRVAEFPAATMDDLLFKIIFADDDGDLRENPHQRSLVENAYAMVGIRPRIERNKIAQLYRRWKHAIHQSNEPDIADEETRRRCDVAREIEGELLSLKSVSAQDIAIKFMVATGEGVFLPDQKEHSGI